MLPAAAEGVAMEEEEADHHAKQRHEKQMQLLLVLMRRQLTEAEAKSVGQLQGAFLGP